MAAISELIEEPLTREALAERYRQLCADPRLANLQGKIELDLWGRILMSPASNYHGMLQITLGQRLASLGGKAIAEASVITSAGILVADVAWASEEFMRGHGTQTPFTQAPEICIEIASPSNSRKELRAKVAAYLEAGAIEAWIAIPHTKRIEFFGKDGPLERSRFTVDLAGIFN